MEERGRPTLYTEEIADLICEGLSEGIPLAEMCRKKGMPARRTVYGWMEKDSLFLARFTRAREVGFDAIAEECLKIADFTDNDTIVTERGAMPDNEWIQRSKLRVETRLKLLAKWSPKRYGDKIDVTSDGEKLAGNDLSDDKFTALIQAAREGAKPE